jgi:hypothetical protein
MGSIFWYGQIKDYKIMYLMPLHLAHSIKEEKQRVVGFEM